jgi:hypothetical protein
MATIVDLSHVLADGTVTYPGLPAPVIGDFLSRAQSRAHYAPGTEFQIGQLTMCANTGTCPDSPFHRYADSDDLAALPLDRLADLDAVRGIWSAAPTAASARCSCCPTTSPTRPSSSIPDGTGTGEPIATSRVTRS